jgi:hypothetical protein
VTHGVADDRKRLLGDRLVGGDIIRCVEEALVDLEARHEAVDFDRMGALDLDGFEFLVLDHEVLPLGDLVAAALVFRVDRLAGLLIDELLAQPVPLPLSAGGSAGYSFDPHWNVTVKRCARSHVH